MAHWFKAEYSRGTAPGDYIEKTFIARDELELINLIYTMHPSAIIFDITQIERGN